MIYIYIPTFTINLGPNVGKYTSPMDAMGYDLNFQFSIPWVMGGVGGASEAIGISTSLILLHG